MLRFTRRWLLLVFKKTPSAIVRVSASSLKNQRARTANAQLRQTRAKT